MKLRGKNILITGGARLGVPIAEMLAKEGANITLTYRKSKKIARNTAKTAAAYGVKSFIIQADLTKAKSVRKAFKFAKKKLKRIDAVIHMASTMTPKPFKTVTEKFWDLEMANNTKTAFLCGKMASEFMRSGIIIFFSDAKLIDPEKDRIPYYAAKAGVHMLIKLLAREFGGRIKVYGVAPGRALTPLYFVRRKKIDRSKEVAELVKNLLKKSRKRDIGKIFPIS